MANKPIGFLKDAHGDNSSKRLWGSVSMILGLSMKLIFSIIALTPLVSIDEISIRLPLVLGAADGILMAGAALLGMGVIEGFQPKTSSNDDRYMGV